jgi:Tol biopolymer transport system component/DNA-binding winged helix-turn-helix (wHTH) protein
MREFPPFRLDAENGYLWRGPERIALTPKAFSVLQYLVERAGRLVTQQELLDALWKGTFVQPEVLKSHILDIRNALGDNARNPSFIETVPRRGYRFVAALTNGSDLAIPSQSREIAGEGGMEASPRLSSAAVVSSRVRWFQGLGLVVVIGLIVAGGSVLVRRNKLPAQHPLRQITFEAGIARDPALSPDGKLLAYVSDRGGKNQFDIWLSQMSGGEPLRLTSGSGSKTNPRFSPDGTKIYFLSRGDLFEVPAFGGVSRKLFERAGPFSVSIRDEIAFYIPGTGGAPSPITILSSERGSSETWHPECVAVEAPAWSPDGNRLAFAGECRGSANLSIMVAPRRKGGIQQISPASSEQLASRLTWFRLGNGSEGLLLSAHSGDSMNIFRVSLDGTQQQITSGTGLETSATVSQTGELVFSRAESSSGIWSIALTGNDTEPTQEAAPAILFAASMDGTKLVYGRMRGALHGELVLRDRQTGSETVLAAQGVMLSGFGSFWPQISPDGKRVIYRTLSDATGNTPATSVGTASFQVNARNEIHLVSIDGGTPRLLPSPPHFALASDWRPDGTALIGECEVFSGGICDLDPRTGSVHRLLQGSPGEQLLYPSFSWDGKWLAFMRRREGRTAIVITPVQQDGRLAGESQWIGVSQDDGNTSRPRFAPNGASIYYLIDRGASKALMRRKLDPISKMPVSDPVQLFSVPFSSPGVGGVALISVSRDRIFFNTSEVHSNLWMSNIE